MTAGEVSVVCGRRAVAEAVRAGRAREVLIARESRTGSRLGEIVEVAARAGVPVRFVSRHRLDGLAPDHHGVIARTHEIRTLGERDLETWSFAGEDVVVVLDGITDPQNLGAAARSAEAAGASMLVTRIRRASPITPAAVQASAGALLHLPHARVANVTRAIERLQRVGFTAVALDSNASRTVYEEPCPSGRVAIVIGSEGSGLSRLVREGCDVVVRLPMRGKVESLNAAASLAAALYCYVLPTRSRT